MTEPTAANEPTLEVTKQGDDSGAVYTTKFSDAPALSDVQAEGTGTPTTLAIQPKGAPDRPGWLPAKFKTPEDMARSYAEMERRMSTPAPAPAAPAKGKAAEAPAPAPAAFNFDGYQAELVANGELSAASYAALESAGIPRAMTNAYIDGQRMVAKSVMSDAMEAAGGQDGFQAMSAWAQENLDESSLSAFNEDVGSGRPDRVMYAIRGLRAMYQSAGAPVRDAPAQVQVAGRGVSGARTSDRFASKAEQVRAMRNPRYQTDPAYQKQVMDKTLRSGNLG